MPKKPQKPNFQIWIIASLVLAVMAIMFYGQGNTVSIDKTDFEDMILNGDVEEVALINKKYAEVTLTQAAIESEKYKDKLGEVTGFAKGPQFSYQLISSPESFETQFDGLQAKLPADSKVRLVSKTREDFGSWFLSWGFFILLLVAFWFMMRRMTGGGAPGGQIFNIGKSKAALFDAQNKVKTTFKDVAGLEEAKEEIQEIVEFLKKPAKFTKLGGKIPKGALLVGPPGTGKTLLARAVAGEAEVPFFSLSGSDFVEMFVGVGAARVRDLFKQAKEKAPCIIFIDEIDAIGRSRGRGAAPGSNDERENTLNSLLVEMDGFATDSGIIILAATNRPDVLDSALLRPGRFDRQISIDKPDLVGREAIFKVHLLPLKLDEGVNPKKLAAQTPGFAGAEIANVCNEAALIAARKNRESVVMQDFHDAIDRVIGGLEKKNKIISPEEKKIVAYHEAGHAVAGWFLEHADPLVKVSIVPRGVAALGYAQYLPREQYLYQTEQLLDEMCMTLGGRAAEQIIFGRISTGAQNDLERITKMAYSIVTVYGMNDKIGNVSFYDSKAAGEMNFTKPYSDYTAKIIDEEVKKIVTDAYDRTVQLLTNKKVELETIAKALLKREIIFQSDLVDLIGARPFSKETNWEAYTKEDPETEDKKVTPDPDSVGEIVEEKVSGVEPKEEEETNETNV